MLSFRGASAVGDSENRTGSTAGSVDGDGWVGGAAADAGVGEAAGGAGVGAKRSAEIL